MASVGPVSLEATPDGKAQMVKDLVIKALGAAKDEEMNFEVAYEPKTFNMFHLEFVRSKVKLLKDAGVWSLSYTGLQSGSSCD